MHNLTNVMSDSSEANIDVLKSNSRNARKVVKYVSSCHKDTMSLRRHSTFNTGFVYILHYFLVFLLIRLNR